MRHIDESTLNPSLINEKDHGFHEGSCMRKRGDKYYLIYCDTARGKATCLSYAIGNSPLGPFTKAGVIIDNDGCDPKNWNNHGSIIEFQGQWYVFYHRSSKASHFNRRVCIEPIFFDDDGHIAEVEMTTQGAEGPIPATRKLEAVRACLLTGLVRSEVIDSTRPDEPGREFLGRIAPGDTAAYKYLEFTPGLKQFHARVAAATHGGVIEIRTESTEDPLIGQCEVPCTGGWQLWQEVSCPIEAVKGTYALYLCFRQRAEHVSEQQVCNLDAFWFA